MAGSYDPLEEIVRLRDRMHNVETTLVALKLRDDDMRAWRAHIDPIVEDLREADRIAEAVAKRMGEQRNISLTKVQKWTAIGGITVAALALILEVVFRLIHLVQIT